MSNPTRSFVLDKERRMTWSLGLQQRSVLKEELWYGKIVGNIREMNRGREMGHAGVIADMIVSTRIK